MNGVIGPVSITGDASGPIQALRRVDESLDSASLATFLTSVVSPWFADRIVDRFAYAGDASVGGPWVPLAAATVRLKRALGYPEDPNERSGDLMAHLAYDHGVRPWMGGMELVIPDDSDDILRKKILTAQKGQSASSNPLFGGATPARPVLGVGPVEETFVQAALSRYLQDAMR